MTDLIYSDGYINRFGFEKLFEVPGPRVEGIVNLQRRSASGILIEEREFKNIVTDRALDELNSRSVELQSAYCRVGTGSTPPNALQTDLASRIGSYVLRSGDATRLTSGSAPYYTRAISEYRFTPSSGIAGNLAEIGFFRGTGGSGDWMFSRALIKDELGNPTTLTILPDEYLYVTYEIRIHVGSLDDVFTSVSLGSETYDVTVRKFRVNTTDGLWASYRTPRLSESGQISNESTLPTNTAAGLPGGTSYTSSSSQAPYISGSYQSTLTCTSGPTQANIAGGIRMLSILASNWNGFAFLFDKPIPKDNTKTMSITVTNSWSRYVP